MQFWALCLTATVVVAVALAAAPPEHKDVHHGGKHHVEHHDKKHHEDPTVEHHDKKPHDDHHHGHHDKKPHDDHHHGHHDKKPHDDHHDKKPHDDHHHGHHDKKHHAADNHHDEHGHIKYNEKADHDAEIKELLAHIGKVAYRFGDLEHKLDERHAPDRLIRARSMKYRVDRLDGDNECENEKDFFQCGGDDPQCINTLLVCDGAKDCRNGNDEKHCELHLKEGDVFVGTSVFDTCTQRRPDKMKLHIDSVKAETFFPGFPKVAATMSIEVDNDEEETHVAFTLRGAYGFGRNRLVFPPPESDGLSLVGHFDGADFDHFIATIQPEGSQEVCAKFRFVRDDGEDEEDDEDDHDD